MEDVRHAGLHQKPRSGAADLALIEPDGVDDPFDRAVEICVVKHDVRGFPAELERQSFAAAGGGFADAATHGG